MSLRRYLDALDELRKERGCFCEACGVPAKHAHHILPVSMTGIADELVYAHENMIILCDECHALMHPGFRSYEWGKAREGRGRAQRAPSAVRL